MVYGGNNSFNNNNDNGIVLRNTFHRLHDARKVVAFEEERTRLKSYFEGDI